MINKILPRNKKGNVFGILFGGVFARKGFGIFTIMKIERYLILLILVIPVLILRDFTPNNELKYLSIVDEAPRDGHFFTFFHQGELYADKPPLYFWLLMLSKWIWVNIICLAFHFFYHSLSDFHLYHE